MCMTVSEFRLPVRGSWLYSTLGLNLCDRHCKTEIRVSGASPRLMTLRYMLGSHGNTLLSVWCYHWFFRTGWSDNFWRAVNQLLGQIYPSRVTDPFHFRQDLKILGQTVSNNGKVLWHDNSSGIKWKTIPTVTFKKQYLDRNYNDIKLLKILVYWENLGS